MKGYVDLYLLPIAQRFGKIIEDHGALEYREFLGDDLKTEHSAGFPSKIKLKSGEVLISSVVGFRSKSHRDQVNKKTFNDPRMKVLMELMDRKPLCDMKRMLYGGFSTIVKM